MLADGRVCDEAILYQGKSTVKEFCTHIRPFASNSPVSDLYHFGHTEDMTAQGSSEAGKVPFSLCSSHLEIWVEAYETRDKA